MTTPDPLAVALWGMDFADPEVTRMAAELRAALAAQGVYLVTAESLAAALNLWSDSNPQGFRVTTQGAAAILEALGDA